MNTTDTDLNVITTYDNSETIWKYELPMMARFTLTLPFNAKILCIQTQTKYDVELMNFWVLVDTLVPAVREDRHFLIVGTGEHLPIGTFKYIGTTQMAEGRLVFHIFEILSVVD